MLDVILVAVPVLVPVLVPVSILLLFRLVLDVFWLISCRTAASAAAAVAAAIYTTQPQMETAANEGMRKSYSSSARVLGFLGFQRDWCANCGSSCSPVTAYCQSPSSIGPVLQLA